MGLRVSATAICFIITFLTSADAAVLVVGEGKDFHTIQGAVRKAVSGDTIRVTSGVYVETLVVDKRVAILGDGFPAVDGNGNGSVIRIRAPGVVIEGIRIRNSGDDIVKMDAGIFIEAAAEGAIIRSNIIEETAFGIWINGANGIRIMRNHVIGRKELVTPKRGNGIHLWNVRNAVIEENEVEGSRDGIFVDWSEQSVFKRNRIHGLRYGFHYMFSSNNRLEGNATFENRAGLVLMYSNNLDIISNYSYDNRDHGIMFQTMRNCRLVDNIMNNNEKGLFVYDSQYNKIRGNIISNNDIGVHIWAGSVDNRVSGNSFLKNKVQVKYVGAKDQDWSEDGKGNFWSDYMGWDIDRNGIGDIPYETSSAMDRLVWAYPSLKLLVNSPAVLTLRMVENQFPIMRSPGIIDSAPLMRPPREDWRMWVDKSGDRGRKPNEDISFH